MISNGDCKEAAQRNVAESHGGAQSGFSKVTEKLIDRVRQEGAA